MKTTILASALFALAPSASALAQTWPGPEVMPTDFSDAYIADGFDSNDNAQMVGEAIFPNTCFRPASVKHEVNLATHEITVQPQAYYYEGFCLQVLVPYDQTLDFGTLEPGTWRIRQKAVTPGSRSFLGELKVRAATAPSADDYLYAPVSQAFFETKDGKSLVRLTGKFTNSCMRLTEEKVTVQPKAIVIQPISELRAGQDCVNGEFPFEKSVELPKIAKGRYLLHVRSLSGKALNTLVDVN